MRVVALLFLCVAAAHAQPAAQNPDWPCAQRLVDRLSTGATWPGPAAPPADWRNDAPLFALVTDIADRDTPEADGAAKLGAYADAIPPAERAARIPALFGAIVDQTNDVRAPLIARLEQLGRRQRALGQAIAEIGTRIDALPPGAARDELTGDRDLDVRAFQQTQRTMRYACEAPSTLERRLGTYARLLQARLARP